MGFVRHRGEFKAATVRMSFAISALFAVNPHFRFQTIPIANAKTEQGVCLKSGLNRKERRERRDKTRGCRRSSNRQPPSRFSLPRFLRLRLADRKSWCHGFRAEMITRAEFLAGAFALFGLGMPLLAQSDTDGGGSMVRMEGGNYVNEDTVRTARETVSHSVTLPEWTNPRG